MAPSRPPRAPTRALRDPKELLKKRGADLIRKISDKDRYGIFLDPVDVATIDGYAQLIARPMDLSTCQNNLAMGVYRTPMELRADLDLIWSNCCTFNADDSIYFKEAVRLRALAARYYDDLVRALVKDGVASALGLSRSGASPSSRLLPRKPQRPRVSELPTRLTSPSVHHSDIHSVDADVDTNSASASASATPAASFRDVHMRRARSNYDAAVTAAASAIHEARQAAQVAGLPDAPPSGEGQIFDGPNGELRNLPTHQLPPSHVKNFPLFHSKQLKDSCARIPDAWKRIGRRHPRSTTPSAFLSRDRARNVRCGTQYQQFVHKSAPMARRILASILDPQAVQQRDRSLMNNAGRTQAANGVSRNVDNGSKKTGALTTATPNGAHSENKKNGKVDTADAEKQKGSARSVVEKQTKSRKRPRGNVDAGLANGSFGKHADATFVDYLTDLVGSKRLKQAPSQRLDDLAQSRLSVPQKPSIYRLRSLLRSKGIDPSFVSELMTDDPESYSAEQQNQGSVHDTVSASHQRKLEHLLNSNYAIMLNVLRLRSLRENAHESVQETIEDNERDSMERLANGLSLAVGSVPPRFVIHPLDANESLLSLAQSINARNTNSKA